MKIKTAKNWEMCTLQHHVSNTMLTHIINRAVLAVELIVPIKCWVNMKCANLSKKVSKRKYEPGIIVVFLCVWVFCSYQTIGKTIYTSLITTNTGSRGNKDLCGLYRKYLLIHKSQVLLPISVNKSYWTPTKKYLSFLLLDFISSKSSQPTD